MPLFKGAREVGIMLLVGGVYFIIFPPQQLTPWTMMVSGIGLILLAQLAFEIHKRIDRIL